MINISLCIVVLYMCWLIMQVCIVISSSSELEESDNGVVESIGADTMLVTTPPTVPRYISTCASTDSRYESYFTRVVCYQPRWDWEQPIII